MASTMIAPSMMNSVSLLVFSASISPSLRLNRGLRKQDVYRLGYC
jgi:hypothetical protein